MKTSFLLSLVVLARQATSTRYQTLQWDSQTAADCVEWYNNSEDESCEQVRRNFGITPEIFQNGILPLASTASQGAINRIASSPKRN